MRNMKNIIFLILSLWTLSICGQTVSTPKFHLGLGWNLGNQMDAHTNGVANETCWGNGKATQQTFTRLKQMGFTSVRIPVTWLGHIGPAPEYKIEELWLNRVAQLVDYAHKAKLKVVVNIHHDGADSRHWLDIKGAAKDENINRRVKEQLHALWTQIAEKFKTTGHYLMFESMNEIHDGKWGWGDNLNDGGRQYQVLNEWNQVFVDAVRSVGGKNKKRYLGVPGYCTNIDLTIKHFQLPKDSTPNRLLLSVHYYDPHNFTLENKWDNWGSESEKLHVDTTFSRIRDAFVKKGIPVYIGEFGCSRRKDDDKEHFRHQYLDYVCHSAARNGLSLIYWDNGSTGRGRESSGIINHATGEYISNGVDIVRIMREAYNRE